MFPLFPVPLPFSTDRLFRARTRRWPLAGPACVLVRVRFFSLSVRLLGILAALLFEDSGLHHPAVLA